MPRFDSSPVKKPTAQPQFKVLCESDEFALCCSAETEDTTVERFNCHIGVDEGWVLYETTPCPISETHKHHLFMRPGKSK